MKIPGSSGGGSDRRSVIDSSLNGLATTLAILIAFLLTPVIVIQTKIFVADQIIRIYGAEWVDLGTFVYGALLAAILFFISRASLYGLLMVLAGGIGWRLLAA